RTTHSRVMARATDSEDLTATSGSSPLVTLPRTQFRGCITRKKTSPFQEVDADRIKGRGRPMRQDGSSIVLRFGRSHEPAYAVSAWAPFVTGRLTRCFGESSEEHGREGNEIHGLLGSLARLLVEPGETRRASIVDRES